MPIGTPPIPRHAMIDWQVPSMAVVVAEEPGIIEVTEHVGPGIKWPLAMSLILTTINATVHLIKMILDELMILEEEEAMEREDEEEEELVLFNFHEFSFACTQLN